MSDERLLVCFSNLKKIIKNEELFLTSYLGDILSTKYLCIIVLNIYVIETKIPTDYINSRLMLLIKYELI